MKSSFIPYFKENDDFQSVIVGVEEGLREQLVAGLSGSARTLFITSMYEQLQKPIVVLTHNLYHAQKLYDDFTNLFSEDELYLFPANDVLAAEVAIASPELKAQRLEVLNFLAKQKKGIIIAPLAGVKKILPQRDMWLQSIMTFEVGKIIELDSLAEKLVRLGYQRVGMVSTPGDFSIRGGIIDIYPLTEEYAVRIELFDDEVDSIRYFNVEDQRSQKSDTKVEIGPATEVLLSKLEMMRGAEKLEHLLAKSIKKVKEEKVKQLLAENITHEIETVRSGQEVKEINKYLSVFYEKPASLLDYLPEDAIVIMDEISRLQETAESLDKEEAEWLTELIAEGKIVHDVKLTHSFIQTLQKKVRPYVYLSLFLRHVSHTHPENLVNLSSKSMQHFHGQMHLLKNEMDRWQKAGYAVVVLGSNEERMEKLEAVLSDYDIEARKQKSNSPILHGQVQLLEGDLQSGFELPLQKLAVITEEELFKKKAKKLQKKRQKLSNAERIKSYSELNVGDYVVHINHGIGKYLGIETLQINGVHKDYLHIKYQGTDQLYVPVEQIDQVQKYVGSEGKEPKVYKLGGTDWKKVRKKVESSVQDIADDLIKLYAEREASIGYAFSPDAEMQREFEASFPYNETEDQLRSILEIKKDMERERPMDRLLCGDVGYGKTEVAIRAAFKAIMDEKQVAILVPTTILAQQHYETIRERFQDYPINIGLLSRFRSRKQQQETMKGLANGTVDIVVGTHRLLSKDVKYKDLGLLVIDEEQRFGVTHKEKIKKLKANIDVLTLTATPIPRTLHMSMLGVRDLSVIETPPENRFPVQTYVMEYNGALVKEAIEREMARDGQIFFLYNRVEDIERKAEEISMLVPDARVIVAHGKMTENELESVILQFLEGEADVLVSTTIIETGVDIPNVNTLIVFDADRMGLSQLYQLRGRVGRSNRVAYAYFTYRKDKVLTEVAEKRLQAIKEFTELGSGFKIAMRDLSIRGAGNLLGAQQHGFIDSVGFDMYSQLLKEAIEQRIGTTNEEKPHEVELDVELDAYLPDVYISDSRQKIEIYKRFRGLDSIEEIEELKEELLDRFGEYPKEVQYLLKVSEIKVLARLEKIDSVKQQKQQVTILFSEEASQTIDVMKLSQLIAKYGRHVGGGQEGTKFKLVVATNKMSDDEWLDCVKEILEQLRTLKKENVSA
ncbi:transcription-repair coupling factor [Sutcliffiella cohnii]|uniref:Transcription-repair-coupling factor n=1 Tax=Sutcliffiella cohnii TaxID=33932 RepID=A0A223KWY0_9BACI|nr:transcription-repair coupling factor [Sutcliffiella cohnii]AST93985.1 transcription-repair coupling factor [Sutcliffiella cohnii]MED4018411.1 transcription-repair coupling factor [Sutcliffiella cohnii]